MTLVISPRTRRRFWLHADGNEPKVSVLRSNARTRTDKRTVIFPTVFFSRVSEQCNFFSFYSDLVAVRHKRENKGSCGRRIVFVDLSERRETTQEVECDSLEVVISWFHGYWLACVWSFTDRTELHVIPGKRTRCGSCVLTGFHVDFGVQTLNRSPPHSVKSYFISLR